MEEGEQMIASEKKLRDEYACVEWAYNGLKFDLNRYDTFQNSIIPSLALWYHMTNLEFDFGGKDKELLQHFKNEPSKETKMSIVEDLLRTKCHDPVNLIIYNDWSEQSKKEYDGKLINKTEDGTTEINISRAAFGDLTCCLWDGVKASANIWEESEIIEKLLDDPLMKKDKLDREELRSLCNQIKTYNGKRLFNDFIGIKYAMEPKYHRLIRKDQEHTLKYVWNVHVRREMWRCRRKEFPFRRFKDYSGSIRKLSESKVNESKSFTITKTIVSLHRDFISAPSEMNLKLKSGSDFMSSMDKLPDDSRKTLHQMCTKSLEELKKVREHCIDMQIFSQCMENLFEITASDEKLRVDFDSEIQVLRPLLNESENLERLQSSLEAINDKWFRKLSDDYVVLGILLYMDGAALCDDERKKFVRMKVTEAMKTKCSRLYTAWCNSCQYEEVYRDNDDPARVLSSWCDNESELLKSNFHSKLSSTLRAVEIKYEKLKYMIQSGKGNSNPPIDGAEAPKSFLSGRVSVEASEMAAAARCRGTVKWFSNDKGYGFILPDDGAEDLFVHHSSIRSEGFRTLAPGATVEFSVAQSGDRAKAEDVTAPGGGSISTCRPGGNFRGSSGGMMCYNCGKPGHFARECAQGGGGGSCYTCGGTGHLARECPARRPRSGIGASKIKNT